jgi:hypothetical protein
MVICAEVGDNTALKVKTIPRRADILSALTCDRAFGIRIMPQI